MLPTEQLSETDKNVISTFISLLLSAEISLVCLDFDLTVSSVHSGGFGVQSGTIRPVFIEFVAQARAQGLKCCIVTFHPMISLVLNEVKEAFKIPDDEEFVVKGSTNLNKSIAHKGIKDIGKMLHISNAFKEVFVTDNDEEFKPKKVLLIDDDIFNVQIARNQYSVPALHFDPAKPLSHFITQLEQCKSVESLSEKIEFAPFSAGSSDGQSGCCGCVIV